MDPENMIGHPNPDELADAAEGLLPAARSKEVSAHVSGCSGCTATANGLSRVRAALAAAPRPVIPEDVSSRLSAAIAAESRRRRPGAGAASIPGTSAGPDRIGGAPSGEARTGSTVAPYATAARARRPKPNLGSYASRLPTSNPHRWRGFALAAAVAGAALGGGGYLLGSGTALKPPSAGPATVAVDDLGEATRELKTMGQVQPRRFSSARACAEEVVDRPITGVTEIRVGRQAALLVVVKGDGASEAVVVIGCEAGTPSPVLSAPIPP